ncbi:gamma-glutamylcyclotransferase family protein [Candidatus Electronema sp. PJ]|uniref:gamma-glutamylcyclotransferase family protein n=1 Tax=Candidatus Electronema sp. PJ TaxID=3401572 RepID=UPI003AA9B179
MPANTKVIDQLFTYGTLQDKEIQQLLFGCTCVMRKAMLPGWSLYASLQDGYLFIKPDDLTSRVSGSLLAINAEALQAADLWEEVPLLYQREAVLVRLEDGSELEAWAYTRREKAGVPYAGKQLSLLEQQAVLAAAQQSISA